MLLQAELERAKGGTEKDYLGMAESMPGGLNMGNVETLSSGSSSLDKRKIIDLNSMDGHSDEHSMHMCIYMYVLVLCYFF